MAFRDRAEDVALVTPNDNADLPRASDSLLIGTAGTLTCIMVGGAGPVTIPYVPVGYNPLKVRRVLATGTTAALITALYA